MINEPNRKVNGENCQYDNDCHNYDNAGQIQDNACLI